MLVACSYDETLDTCRVRVRLVYPEGSIEPYAGALVELKDANASIFVSETVWVVDFLATNNPIVCVVHSGCWNIFANSASTFL
jgi:hypothetical protein